MKFISPSLALNVSCKYLAATTNESFPGIPADWDLARASSPFRAPPVVSDTLIPEILDGRITLLSALKEITGPRTIHCIDGEEVEIDAIVLCTGYQTDYSLAGRFDLTRNQPAAWTGATGSNSRRLTRMYMNVFSLDIPHNLAFMGAAAFATPIFQIADLASMAVARVWAGDVRLPPFENMKGQVDRLHTWLICWAAEGTVIASWTDGGEWMA